MMAGQPASRRGGSQRSALSEPPDHGLCRDVGYSSRQIDSIQLISCQMLPPGLPACSASSEIEATFGYC